MSRSSAEFEPIDPAPLFDWLQDHYGIPASPLADYSFWSRPGHDDLWIAAGGTAPGTGATSVGTQVWRDAPPKGYLSTAFVRLIGSHATRNVFDIEGADLAAWFSGGTFAPPGSAHKGTVIIRWRGIALGRARKFGELILSELPRHMRVDDSLLHTFAHVPESAR